MVGPIPTPATMKICKPTFIWDGYGPRSATGATRMSDQERADALKSIRKAIEMFKDSPVV